MYRKPHLHVYIYICCKYVVRNLEWGIAKKKNALTGLDNSEEENI